MAKEEMSKNNSEKTKIPKVAIGRIIAFITFLTIIFWGSNFFVQPVWRDWNNYDTMHGFYEEPENTIEVIFLGSSVVVTGIDPMRMYEEYGVCGYNLGTEQQPVLASYYWLLEAYRLHSNSLKTVVLDASMLRRVPEKEFYRKAIDAMKFSTVKYNAVKDCTESYNETLSCLVPMFSYHDRWEMLNRSDFNKMRYKVYAYNRGFCQRTEKYYMWSNCEQMNMLEYCADKYAPEMEIDEEAEYYLEKMKDFCVEKDIQLVLIKAPMGEWTSEAHSMVQRYADKNGIAFLDFNYAPLVNEISYDHAVDSLDGIHMNYWGAEKLSSWIGQYLTEKCRVSDVREDERYTFLIQEAVKYDANIGQDIEMKDKDNLVDYLSDVMELKGYMVFLAIKDEGTGTFTVETRKALEEVGLSKLAKLTLRESYLAVIRDGEIVEEQADHVAGRDNVAEEAVNSAVFVSGETPNRVKYRIVSEGFWAGNMASCVIDGVEYSPNERGINIVVYDYERDKVVDATVFDTFMTLERVSDVRAALSRELESGKKYTELSGEAQGLYFYDRRCNNTWMARYNALYVKEDQIFDYLDTYWGQEDYVIFLSAQEDAAGALTAEVRKHFAELGLQQLAELSAKEPYVAIIDSGDVWLEQRGGGEPSLEAEGMNYRLISGGRDSAIPASIEINDREYSKSGRGINVVVYDKQMATVVDSAVFDTSVVTMVVAE